MKIADSMMRKVAGVDHWAKTISDVSKRAVNSSGSYFYGYTNSNYKFSPGKYALPELAERASKLFENKMLCWLEVAPNDPRIKVILKSASQK